MKIKKCLMLAVSAILVIQMLVVVAPNAGADDPIPEYDNLRFSNLYNGFTVSWTTNIKTNGWMEYSTSLEGARTEVYDLRGEDNVGYTHICTVNLGLSSRGETYYVWLFAGEGVHLTATDVLNITIPDIQDDEAPPSTVAMYGSVVNEISPVEGALVHVRVTRGQDTSMFLTGYTGSEGEFLVNAGNGIFFEDGETYNPQLGDMIYVEANAGPLGKDSSVVTLESVMGPFNLGTLNLPLPFSIESRGVDPDTGDTDTNFTFSLVYSSEEIETPDIYVIIDGTQYTMASDSTDLSAGVKYEYTTTLDEGEHEYRFKVELDEKQWDFGEDTLTVTGVEEIKEEEESSILLILGLLAILIVVVLLAIFLKKNMEKGVYRKKEDNKKNEDAKE